LIQVKDERGRDTLRLRAAIVADLRIGMHV
jgi:hypothetical protein